MVPLFVVWSVATAWADGWLAMGNRWFAGAGMA